MTVDECCNQYSVTKATYYYRLKCVRQAYLDSVEPSFTEFVEMPIADEVENNRGKSSVSAVLNINQSFSMDLLDNALTTFIKKLLGALDYA